MRKIYSTILLFLCVNLNSYSQYGTIFDATHLQLVMENNAMRTISEKQFQSTGKGMKDKLDKINQNYLKVVATKLIVEQSLCSVNSALLNAKSVQNIATQIEEITSNMEKLSTVCRDNPQYSYVGRKYIEYAVEQSLALQTEVTQFALSGSKNIVMNYQQRDEVIRDIAMRLSLINANLILTRNSINRAVRLGFIKGASPFGDWINTDERMVQDIITRSKYL